MMRILDVLAALGQRTRLEVLTLLSRGPGDGQTSGDLALQARVPANSMSTHLSILAAAGLVSAKRSGRNVLYRIERETVERTLLQLANRLLNDIEPQFAGRGLATSGSRVTDYRAGSQNIFSGISATGPVSVKLARAAALPASEDPTRDTPLPAAVAGNRSVAPSGYAHPFRG